MFCINIEYKDKSHIATPYPKYITCEVTSQVLTLIIYRLSLI